MPAQSSRKFSGLPLRIKPIGLWYTSLGFPSGIDHHGTMYQGGLRSGLVHPATHSIKRPHFPAAGYRNNSSGTSINNVGSNGNCWSSSANSDANARNLNINGTNFNWNNNNRANGFSVRPVAEAFADRRTLPFLAPSSSKGKRLHLPFLL